MANLVSAWALLRHGDVKNNINLRSAYFHVLSDALGSVGALVAGLLMQMYEWYIADPIISVVVAVMILKGAWGLINQSIHILMEGTSDKTDVAEITAILAAIEGVVNVHEMHLWTVTSGYEVFSCHIIVRKGFTSSQLLSKAVPLMKQQFGIRHTTIQVVEEGTNASEWGCKGGVCAFSLGQ